MSGNAVRVLLDLNAPTFQDAFFELEPAEIKRVLKTLKKIRGLSWNDLFRDHGLKWEELKSRPGVYTLRVSQSHRALATRSGDYLRLVTLHPDHDGAYGKK